MKEIISIKMNESGIVCISELDCDMGIGLQFILGKGVIYVLREDKDKWIKELRDMKDVYCEDMEYEIV